MVDVALRGVAIGDATDTNAVRARVVAATYHFARGDIDLFVQGCEQAALEAERRDDTDEWVHTEWHKTWLLAICGRAAEAIEAAEHYAARFAGLGSPSVEGFAEGLFARAYAPVDPHQALRHCRRALEIGRRGDHWALTSTSWLAQLPLEVQLSPSPAAASCVAGCLRYCIDNDWLVPHHLLEILINAADICARQGDGDTALEIDGHLHESALATWAQDRLSPAVAGAADHHPDPEEPRFRGAALSEQDLIDRVLAALDHIAVAPHSDGDRSGVMGDPTGD